MSVTNFTNARYLSIGTTTLITAYPCTLAYWFNVSGVATTPFGLNLGNNGAAGFLGVGPTSTRGIAAQAQPDAGGGGTSTTASSLWTDSTWAHACGVFLSSTSRTAYANGTAASANTTAATLPSIDFLTVGALRRSSLANPMPTVGMISHAGVWNVALSATEVAQLAAGVHPVLIHPTGLVWFSSLINTAYVRNNFANEAFTVTGAVADGTSEPPIQNPNAKGRLILPMASAPPSSSPVPKIHQLMRA